MVGVKYDDSKLDWSLLLNSDFNSSLEQVVKVMELGASKYSRDNWKKLDKERIEKALLRHVVVYASGQEKDNESEQSHLAHIISNCLFLMWFDQVK